MKFSMLGFCVTALVATFTFAISGSALNGQVVPADRIDFSNSGGAIVMNFDDLNQPALNQLSAFYHVTLGGQPFLDWNSAVGSNPKFRINVAAPQFALMMSPGGVGMGILDATSKLHLFSDGTGLAARAHIQETNPTPGLREILRLENNGGVQLRMIDNSIGGATFRTENVIGLYEIATGPAHFRISSDSPSNLMNLMSGGVGLGTQSPIGALHILADNGVSSGLGSASIITQNTNPVVQDRIAMSASNNGGVFLSMTDTSRPTLSQWAISLKNDTFALKKAGANSPGMTIDSTGAMRFSNNGFSNCTVASNGDLFARGAIRSNGPILGGSDRNTKENIQPVDTQEILAKVVNLPITTWNYIADEKDTPHMGPMAQDFFQSFQLGDDDKTIAYMDKDGVALAAIQGLYKTVASKDQAITELTQSVQAQQEVIDELSARLERLEAAIAPANK